MKISKLILLIALALIIFSCNKDNNKISGYMSIHDKTTDQTTAVNLGTVSLYKENSKIGTDLAFYSIRTGNDGFFSFDRIPKGNFKLNVVYTDSVKIDSTVTVSFNKKDNIKLSIVLEK